MLGSRQPYPVRRLAVTPKASCVRSGIDGHATIETGHRTRRPFRIRGFRRVVGRRLCTHGSLDTDPPPRRLPRTSSCCVYCATLYYCCTLLYFLPVSWPRNFPFETPHTPLRSHGTLASGTLWGPGLYGVVSCFSFVPCTG